MLKTRAKSFIKNLYDRYFPTIRWQALLILLPALVIGLYNFLDVFSEVVFEKRRSPTAVYASRFAPIQKDLPANAAVNYATDQKWAPDFILARYAVIPARLKYGLKPRFEFLVAHYPGPGKIPEFDGYKLKKNYQNGVMLFQRSP